MRDDEGSGPLTHVFGAPSPESGLGGRGGSLVC